MVRSGAILQKQVTPASDYFVTDSRDLAEAARKAGAKQVLSRLAVGIIARKLCWVTRTSGAKREEVRVVQRARWGGGRYPMPRFPLWFVLRVLVLDAVLLWLFVIVGRQLVRSIEWRTDDWHTGLGALVVVGLLTVLAVVWFPRQVRRLVEKAKGGDKKLQG